MSAGLLKKAVARAGVHALDSHDLLGDETLLVKVEGLVALMTWLRDDAACAMDLLRDVTAVDYEPRQPRFEVVYQLYSLRHRHRLRVRVPLDGERPTLPTVSHLWRSANWGEREVWDMYGIHFEGHPDLRRILMYDEFEGHPLRKDYPVQQSQPRMDLRRRERDAVEEYQHFHVGSGRRAAADDNA
jgi:NADH-quinone oxidoreductase subunit C